MRDIYNRKKKLSDWIEKVNQDLDRSDRMDVLKFVDHMTDNANAILWIIRCITALISMRNFMQCIIDEDVEFEVLQENFSVYDLSNDFVLSIKTVLGQVKKTDGLTATGEPIYTVNVNPIIKFKKK